MCNLCSSKKKFLQKNFRYRWDLTKITCNIGENRGNNVNINCIKLRIAVADPGFSRGGDVNPPGGREHAKFSRKLHEIERIWTPRGGGRASLTPPLDPPMDRFKRIPKLSTPTKKKSF